MAFVRGVWEKIPDDHPDKRSWNWNTQRLQIEAACYGHIQKHCGEEPRLMDTLPERLLNVWRDIECRGGTPKLQKRRFWGVEDSGPAPVIPDVAEVTPTVERKHRFKLISFQDMRTARSPS